jgi:hypothetical protein
MLSCLTMFGPCRAAACHHSQAAPSLFSYIIIYIENNKIVFIDFVLLEVTLPHCRVGRSTLPFPTPPQPLPWHCEPPQLPLNRFIATVRCPYTLFTFAMPVFLPLPLQQQCCALHPARLHGGAQLCIYCGWRRGDHQLPGQPHISTSGVQACNAGPHNP